MIRRSLIFSLLLLTMPQTGHGQNQQGVPDLVFDAQQKQQQGDTRAAAQDYKRALQQAPDSPELWTNLGLMQYESGNHSEALDSFQKAYRLKPSLYVPNLFIGEEDLRAGKGKEAIPFLERATKMRGTDIQAIIALGRAYAMSGEFVSAASQFANAVKLYPADGEPWFRLCIALIDQVEKDSRVITAIKRDSPYTKMLLAESLVRQGRYIQAADLYKEVLHATDGPPCAKWELAFVYLKQNNAAAAKSLVADESRGDRPCAVSELVKASLQLGDNSPDYALTTMRQLWDHDRGFVRQYAPVLVDALTAEQALAFSRYISVQHDARNLPEGLYSALGSALRRERIDRSIAQDKSEGESGTFSHSPEHNYLAGNYELCAKGDIQRIRNSRQSLGILAACSFLTGEFALSSTAGALLEKIAPESEEGLYWSIKANEERANEALRTYEELEPESEQAHLLRGDMSRQRRLYDQALAEYKKAHDLAPEDPAALLGMAYAYLGNNNFSATMDTARAALSRSPHDPETNLLLGEALISRQQYAAAKPYLREALGAKPHVLPHVYALLGVAEAETGKPSDAIDLLKRGSISDTDGSLHYRLARLYRQVGNSKDAEAALEEMKAIQKQRREAAAIAIRERPVSEMDRSE